MGELIFKSAGVSSREIDLSFPTQQRPTGVPAGIIGTSNEGPAFVPVTIGNFTEFQTIFGASDGEKFGPLAVAQWLRNAQSCTYIRVLGIGDGKKRTATGKVTNAGFLVGRALPQASGYQLSNTYANDGEGGIEGRTYILGCFMSESAGSTIFSSAGIQNTAPAATAATASIQAVSATAAQYDAGTLTITDTNGTTKTYIFDDNSAGATGTVDGSDRVRIQINGLGTCNVIAAQIKAAIEHANGHDGTISIAVSTVDAANDTLTLTQTTAGWSGNKVIERAVITADNIYTITNFTAGKGPLNHAVPILRGVLMAPSGVIMHLSGNYNASNAAPVSTETARSAAIASAGKLMGRHGGTTGSLDISTQDFTLLLNGHKGTSTYPNVLTASFDMLANNYISNIFNTDPYKIEEAGHLLYGHYDIYPSMATITGSGALVAGHRSKGVTAGETLKEDIVFLLTSSVGRSATGATATSVVPDFEDFEDRFATAKSPYVVSQKYGGSNKDLFRIHALSAGSAVNTRFKISIENLSRRDDKSYGTFDLVVRDFNDSDESKVVLESFRNITLDLESNRFIGRAIGDLNLYFDFDKDERSQKLNVAGNHAVRSKYIRVELSNDLKNDNIPIDALPMGFRGPLVLNTSGSIINHGGATHDAAQQYFPAGILNAATAPAIPFRETVALGTGNKKRDAANLYWGVQFNRKTDVDEPNKPSAFDATMNSLVKYFPTHRKGIANLSEASDTFNNNLFSLENLKIVTGSDEKADPDYWRNASYVRNGVIVTNDTSKTRVFMPKDLEVAANRRYAKFSFLLQGGFDGLNIFNQDKVNLANNAAAREIADSSEQGGTAGSTVAAYRKAIDVMGSKSDVNIKLLATPGMRTPSVTDYGMSAMESRFDALYIMDIEEKNNYNIVITGSSDGVHVKNTVTNFRSRGLDSSFAAAYFPDVIIEDPTTNTTLSVPPSVAVLGAFSLNDAVAHPWFAPAGFTRGALDVVESASVRLSRKNLDDLYQADINPLTAFPGTGVVVWGQKTLLSAASALDRVNVRRLLIDVRRSVRAVANSLLFEPNRQETLDKFNGLVNPILQRVQEKGGVDRFKVIIDTTTTTQADVENNTIRGKIFLQPTRAVEFIALDFVVTNAGAEI